LQVIIYSGEKNLLQRDTDLIIEHNNFG